MDPLTLQKPYVAIRAGACAYAPRLGTRYPSENGHVDQLTAVPQLSANTELMHNSSYIAD